MVYHNFSWKNMNENRTEILTLSLGITHFLYASNSTFPTPGLRAFIK